MTKHAESAISEGTGRHLTKEDIEDLAFAETLRDALAGSAEEGAYVGFGCDDVLLDGSFNLVSAARSFLATLGCAHPKQVSEEESP